jgi:hypothetical protein
MVNRVASPFESVTYLHQFVSHLRQYAKQLRVNPARWRGRSDELAAECCTLSMLWSPYCYVNAVVPLGVIAVPLPGVEDPVCLISGAAKDDVGLLAEVIKRLAQDIDDGRYNTRHVVV